MEGGRVQKIVEQLVRVEHANFQDKGCSHHSTIHCDY